jgi:hypothetical protein
MHLFARIRFGFLTLVVGGLLGFAALVLRGPAPLPNVDVDAWAQVVTDSNYFLTQVLTIFAYVIPFFGFWGIYASLSKNEKVEKFAFWGFMCSIIGTSLAIATLGVFSFVSPSLAELYLQGDNQVPEIITQVAIGQPSMINFLGGTLYLLGTILLGVAIWRSNLLPKWSGMMIAAHGLSLVIGFVLFPLLLLSWVFLVIAGIWIFMGYKNDESINK